MVDFVSFADAPLDAWIGGIPFLYLDADDLPGRRVLRFMYPGSDVPDFQDIGREDGPLRITGMVVGDDWISQANALRDLFATPGPYTLVHPWLGTFLVMPADKPRFSDSQSTLRATKFELSLWRYWPAPMMLASTYASLISEMEALRDAIDAVLAIVLAPAALIVSALAIAQAFVAQVVGWVASAVLGGLATVVATGLDVLVAAESLYTSATYATSLAEALAEPFVELADASNPEEPAAIGPGTAAVTTTPIDGRETATAMLSVASAAATQSIAGEPAPVLAIAVQVYALSYACVTASDIDFTDATEATTWRDRIATALDTAAAAAGTAAADASDTPTAVALGALWQQLATARQAWFADMNAVIGRLPAVQTLTLPGGGASVWLVAQYLAGDDPTTLIATVETIVSRNALTSPATGGTIEVLES